MIATIILLALAGIMTAFMDRTSTAGEFNQSIFRKCRGTWFGPRIYTWKNKYASRLPFSTTILVFLTDSWHFFKELQLLCIYIAIALNISLIDYLQVSELEALTSYPLGRMLIDVLLYKAILAGSFYIFYANILTMNFWQKLKEFMYEMNFLKGVIIVLPFFLLWIGMAELINLLDPRYSPTDDDTTFIGDIIMSVALVVTFFALAWKNFRKSKAKGKDNA